ncbi:MAG: protein kinase [Phycisphaerales bacterium]|nr:protein kinase [Phycisphaerales bacterium]
MTQPGPNESNHPRGEAGIPKPGDPDFGATIPNAAPPILAGRYRVIRKLGEGGMGEVHLVEDAHLDGRRFAVKMPPAVLARNVRAVEALKKECLRAMALSHPHIVTVRSFEQTDDAVFIVMDYVQGQTLEELLTERGTLPEAEVLRIFEPIAEALDYAHRKNLVHRDIKPSNIMLAEDGTPFIMDFGIAREVKETFTRVTGQMTSGTLPYMSPEQLRGKPADRAQDVYNLAATIYECLVGHPPFHRGQIEYQIVHEAPQPPSDASPALAAQIMKGLAKSPEYRPKSCKELLALKPADAAPPGKRRDVQATPPRKADRPTPTPAPAPAAATPRPTPIQHRRPASGPRPADGVAARLLAGLMFGIVLFIALGLMARFDYGVGFVIPLAGLPVGLLLGAVLPACIVRFVTPVILAVSLAWSIGWDLLHATEGAMPEPFRYILLGGALILAILFAALGRRKIAAALSVGLLAGIAASRLAWDIAMLIVAVMRHPEVCWEPSVFQVRLWLMIGAAVLGCAFVFLLACALSRRGVVVFAWMFLIAAAAPQAAWMVMDVLFSYSPWDPANLVVTTIISIASLLVGSAIGLLLGLSRSAARPLVTLPPHPTLRP